MKKTTLLMMCLCISGFLHAQDKPASEAQANNPLANTTAINLQNNYVMTLTNAPDEAYTNTTWVRFAKPFASGKLLMRVSAPLSTVAVPNAATGNVRTTNGLGDINAFLAYSFVSKPTATLGVGPLLSMPTAAKDALGSGKWQGGIAFVAFIAKSPVFQFGGLATWQASFAGNKDRTSTNFGAIQPFYFLQLGKGTYLRGAPTWAFNFKDDAFSMPLGLGIGKVVKTGNTVFNLFIEPQYTMLHNGVQPQFQVFTGINLQFSK